LSAGMLLILHVVSNVLPGQNLILLFLTNRLEICLAFWLIPAGIVYVVCATFLRKKHRWPIGIAMLVASLQFMWLLIEISDLFFAIFSLPIERTEQNLMLMLMGLEAIS
jgi:hypothetical protein